MYIVRIVSMLLKWKKIILYCFPLMSVCSQYKLNVYNYNQSILMHTLLNYVSCSAICQYECICHVTMLVLICLLQLYRINMKHTQEQVYEQLGLSLSHLYKLRKQIAIMNECKWYQTKWLKLRFITNWKGWKSYSCILLQYHIVLMSQLHSNWFNWNHHTHNDMCMKINI